MFPPHHLAFEQLEAERGGAPMYVDGIEGGVVEREITLPAGDA